MFEVPSDPRGAGKCAFAKEDVERGQVVAEYTRELISMMEATEREAEYATVGKTCTLMVIRHRGQSLLLQQQSQAMMALIESLIENK